MSSKKLILAFSILLITLFLRDTPYFNLLFVSKVWLLYPIILLVVLVPDVKLLTYLIPLGFIASFALTIFGLTSFAGLAGEGVYFFVWIILIVKMRIYLTKHS